MQRINAHGQTVKGLDVSHYDAHVDFAKVKAAGYEFVWAKATEGIAVVDPLYKESRAKAQAAGLLFGAYHFFRPGLDPLQQATHFLNHAKPVKGDLVPMFDWEVTQDRANDPHRASVWLTAVSRAIGTKPLIYGPPYMLNDFGLPAQFADYPLCVAHYGTLAPLVPAPWKVWSFHQFAEKGGVPGVPIPNVDHDRFNGDLETLKKFCL